jgi:hypothetical protein
LSSGAGSGAATRAAPTSRAATAFGGVSRGEATGRVAAARYTRREWFGAIPGAREVVWPRARRGRGVRPTPAANGVVTARNREERGEMVVRAKP